jgi:shikimate dehydrogenase
LIDWIGAVRAFNEVTELDGKNAAVIGAGGGARAIVYGLKRAGAAVTIFNRSEDQGRRLAADMAACYGGPPESFGRGSAFDLLAHATPVGFHEPDRLLISPQALRAGMVVFDAVPVPLETRLLCEAKARGCRTLAGVRMQLHQALCQFALYTGKTADLAVMENALLNAMARL